MYVQRWEDNKVDIIKSMRWYNAEDGRTGLYETKTEEQGVQTEQECKTPASDRVEFTCTPGMTIARCMAHDLLHRVRDELEVNWMDGLMD